MENIPNIVKERLKSTATALDHPDADLLAAFAERALADRERSQLLQHLAHCADCREIIALALPAEEPGPVMVRPTRGNWLAWPQLRWGLVAAGVIVVGSFGVLRYERSRDLKPVAVESARPSVMLEEAKNQSEAVPVPSREVPHRKLAGTPAQPSSDLATTNQMAETKKKSVFDAIELADQSRASQDGKTTTGSRSTVLRSQPLPHGPMPPAQWQQNLNANSGSQQSGNQQMMSQSQATPPPASGPTGGALAGVTVSSQSSPTAAGPSPSDKQTQSLDNLAINARSVTALPSVARNNTGEVARAKDAQPPTTNAPRSTSAYDISETATTNFSPSGSLIPESARWAINSSGGLQRSFDQGNTWQTVDVNSGDRDSAGMSLELAMKSSRAKAPPKNEANTKSKPLVFRAVAANGPDVWAGASEANLFHSTDSGDHWIRIQPSWRGAELTGDIVSLQFADPQHGRIVTSSAEIWMTADAGQTWDKQ